jgi:hypothetical protein
VALGFELHQAVLMIKRASTSSKMENKKSKMENDQ